MAHFTKRIAPDRSISFASVILMIHFSYDNSYHGYIKYSNAASISTTANFLAVSISRRTTKADHNSTCKAAIIR